MKSGKKYTLALYGNGQFQGYIKSVSTFKFNVTSTNNVSESKKYAQEQTANKDAILVQTITQGNLSCNLVEI